MEKNREFVTIVCHITSGICAGNKLDCARVCMYVN